MNAPGQTLKAMIMLRTAARLLRPPRSTRPPGLPRPAHSRRHGGPLGRTGAVSLVMGLGLAVAGCSAQAAATEPRIELGTAYVGQPQGSNPTDAYLAIRNNGPATRLIGVRTSVGGTVMLRGPSAAGPSVMQTDSFITIPSHSLLRLEPNAYHLMIIGAGHMKAGTDITLTLEFAKAGSFQVAAEVTNPQTGGGSYFLN